MNRCRWLLLALLLVAPAMAEGLVLRAPAVLYDGPSERALPLLILTGGHPLRPISGVDGWRKVAIAAGANGWVRERHARSLRAAVVTAKTAAVRLSPAAAAAEVFYARQGVVLEVLRAAGGWLEVAHADGETGYVAHADVWLNH